MSQNESKIDFDSLKSLNSDLGIDMSFIDAMKKDYKNEAQDNNGSSSKLLSNLDENTSKELQETIQKNAALIQELKVICIPKSGI